MSIFHRKSRLPVPLIHPLREELDQKDVNFVVRFLGEFSLFLLARARRTEKPEGVSYNLLRREVIDPGIHFEKEKVDWDGQW